MDISRTGSSRAAGIRFLKGFLLVSNIMNSLHRHLLSAGCQLVDQMVYQISFETHNNTDNIAKFCPDYELKDHPDWTVCRGYQRDLRHDIPLVFPVQPHNIAKMGRE